MLLDPANKVKKRARNPSLALTLLPW